MKYTIKYDETEKHQYLCARYGMAMFEALRRLEKCSSACKKGGNGPSESEWVFEHDRVSSLLRQIKRELDEEKL